jgi:tetratricopeptide (TPR) repeat protein
MNNFPRDKKELQQLITRYERSLLEEQDRFGGIMDSAGKRYLLGPFYLLSGDVPGALRSFEWFERKFPDDIGEPFQYLCWALILYKSGNFAAARKKLLETVLSNHYIIPILLGEAPAEIDMRHGSNADERAWITEGPTELFELWDSAAKKWAAEAYEAPQFKKLRNRHIEIYRALETEENPKKRSALLNEARGLSEKLE